MSRAGTLYVVATPIGNADDLTPRAARVLREAGRVLCEERREGRALLARLGVGDRLVDEVNEHTERSIVPELVAALRDGAELALVSDCGTPVVADPGAHLIGQAAAAGVRVVPVPGASAFLAALMVSGFDANRFVFQGTLPVKREARERALAGLPRERRTQILFDAPYRLERTMEDLASVFDERPMVLALDLTTPAEQIVRGAARTLAKAVCGRNWKREFVVVIGPVAERPARGNPRRFRA